MGTEETGIVVIGMGPGGEDAAGRLAEAGLHVTGVEASLVGGECPYWGCVPSKMMIRAADLLAEARRIPGMAGTSSVNPDWAPVARRIREEATDFWDDKVAVDRFTGKGGHFVRGRGRITGPREVTVDTADGPRVLRARQGIVIATGTEPAVPPVPGLAGTPYWTNREAIETEEVPESLIVLGGGAVGAELAQVLARFGAQVTVVEALPRLLPAEEPEAGDLLAGVFAREGIAVRAGARAERVSHDGTQFTVTLAGGETLTAVRLLVATGRRSDLAALGVAAAGLDAAAGVIEVDSRMRATDGIWALGDITGKGAVTHVAMYQAGIAVADILGQDRPGADYRALPRVTFTDPEIGSVGLTETQAKAQGTPYEKASFPWAASGRALSIAREEGATKVLLDPSTRRILGMGIVGSNAGELIAEGVLALEMGADMEDIGLTIHPHPTLSETLCFAAEMAEGTITDLLAPKRKH